MWRLSVRNFTHFARYETPMIAGFRKYALLYRKTATMQSRDSLPTKPTRPLIGNSPLLIRSRRDLLGGRSLGMGLPLTAHLHRCAAHHDPAGICANEPR
jgi:hypothetical protein